MQQIKRKIPRFFIILIATAYLTLMAGMIGTHASQPGPTYQHEVGDNHATTQNLLPPHCPSVTPSGGDPPLCCVSGSVWLAGERVEGAEVTFTFKGESETVRTKPRDGASSLFEYGIAPSAAPLNADVGKTVQITAEFADRSVTIDYVLQKGTQRVDLALPSTHTGEGYAYHDQIWHSADPGHLLGPHGIALDSENNLYVVDRENQRIQVFDPTGKSLHTWGSLGNKNNEFFSPFGIALDSSDNVYVADTGNHRILKFNKRGTHIQEIGSFGSEIGQFYKPEGIAIDRDDSIYVADSANHRIQKFRSDGDLDTDFGTEGAVGSIGSGDAQFRYPTAMAFDSQNNLYITDFQNDRVQKFDSDGNFLLTFGESGNCISASGCRNGDLRFPDGIAIDGNDNIYVSDTNHRVQKFDSNGTWLGLFGQRGTNTGQFEFPKGLAVDSSGTLYVADEFNHRIQKFDSTFAWQATWGEDGNNDQQLSSPQGTAVDSQGNLYIADDQEHRIQKFGPDGQWLNNIGQRGTNTGQFNSPQDIAVDSEDNLYVADTGNNRIQKIDRNGSFIAVGWGSSGTGDGQFREPVALALDDDNNVYVVDKFNHRIQKFDASGTHLANWGGGLGSSAEGKFNAPRDIAVAPTGHVYVADASNHRIQKFNQAGQHLATIGEFGGQDGQFNTVTGVEVDSAGNIYAVDDATGRIQKFDADGNHLLTWGVASIRENEGGDSAPRFNQLGKELRITVDHNGKIYVSDTENNRLQTYLPETTGTPIAFINWYEKRNLESHEKLTIRGMGQDTDSSNIIRAFEWLSDREDRPLKEGQIATANFDQSSVDDLVIPASDLTSGTHIISLRVQDDEGEWSIVDTLTIFISPPGEVVWTVLLYLAADYEDNESLLTTFVEKIDQLEAKFTNPAVRIAIQLDGPGSNDTRRYTLTPGNSKVENLMGELAMDNPNTLAEFIRWGQGEFPAQKYYLVIADHGQAIQGIAWDKTSDEANALSPLASRLTVQQIGEALNAPDVDPVDILHLDACSMNLLETAYEFREYTDYLISSQWMGWDYFAYDSYVGFLNDTVQPRTVAEEIVKRYAQLAEEDEHPYTISALDMTRSGVALEAIDALASELASYLEANPDERAAMEEIREEIQTFESDGDYENSPLDMYVDIIAWAQRLQTAGLDQAVRQRASALIEELVGRMIMISDKNSAAIPSHVEENLFINNSGANGLSIFYPINQNSITFQRYVDDELFSFTSAPVSDSWIRFLRAATVPRPEGQPPENAPPPLPPISGQMVGTPEPPVNPPDDVTVTPPTPTHTHTSTPTPTSTSANIPPDTNTPTNTPAPTSTSTSTPTSTSVSAPTPSPTRTPGDERNNSCDQASTLMVNGIAHDYAFQTQGDVDWLRVELTAGGEYRLDITTPNDSLADVEPELHANCDSLPANEEWRGTFGPGARLFLTPDESGPIYLRLANRDSTAHGDAVNYQVTISEPLAAPQSRAAIIVAGLLKENDPLQNNIHHVTDQAFALFQNFGYSDDDIYYLVNDRNITERDADATLQTIRLAITDWAKDRLGAGGVLNLYIIDHGDEDKIYINGPQNDILNPTDLDSWLNELEAEHPGLKVNIFIEACHAGSFIEGEESISKEGRVVVTSSDVDWVAYASDKGAYFSDHLLTNLWQGHNLFHSFWETSGTVQGLFSRQQPWLDADGDTNPNQPNDFAIASAVIPSNANTFSNNDDWAPFIAQVNQPTVEGQQGIIQAVVRDDGRLDEVWAVIYPPSYEPLADSQEELVQETLQTLKLTAKGDDTYAVDYRAFNEEGTYRIVVHAEDNQGMVARPVGINVEVAAPTHTPTPTPTATPMPTSTPTPTPTSTSCDPSEDPNCVIGEGDQSNSLYLPIIEH